MTARMQPHHMKQVRFTIMRHCGMVYNATRRLQANRIHTTRPLLLPGVQQV